MRLLLVEDHDRLRLLTAEGLQQKGFVVDPVGTAADADAALRGIGYDAVILDLGLPDQDGLALLATWRQRGVTVPVLILTARDKVSDRIAGLNRGGDDYLVKPFAFEELLARIRALLRRAQNLTDQTITLGNVIYDPIERTVTVKGVLLSLGRRELNALEFMMGRPGRVVSRQHFEDALYAFGEEIASNAIEVLISRLRKRLTVAEATVQIQTLRGLGYLLKPL